MRPDGYRTNRTTDVRNNYRKYASAAAATKATAADFSGNDQHALLRKSETATPLKPQVNGVNRVSWFR
ncbi:hypothetical protein Vau01_055280 [Virgisporangium aurantiacum]|uniref:Uncharacterized protein n=1 Tax=Virgisporangium aurantiacum TaxID=175570 RepID=A0A8J3Z7W0_9ACTN|nr:hypothetical protein Vau01_055280 [Virgisporangium aurantiacum]